MKRNIAFFITSNNEDLKALRRAESEFLALVKKFEYQVQEYNIGLFKILISFENIVTIKEEDRFIEFPIGNLGEYNLKNDRFLKIKILKDTIEIENDYAGTIPVYYSNRKYLSLSNIEPCVMIDTKTTKNDLSHENIYGFMRYMHFIWDETAYKHILTILPDSFYIFNGTNLTIETKYLKSVFRTHNYVNLSDTKVSKKLNDLNDELVYESLENFEQIILPLSSGYDSRMILVALAKREDLKEKLHCFTYGSIGSVEVEAARRLTQELGVKWDFIDLPSQFCKKNYLEDIHDVFGSSLHMHGMYQLEFFNEIIKKIKINKNACLTSGFMTGVPAGQHNSLLGIENNENLAINMNKFSQSKIWTDKELNEVPIFINKNYINKANERFRMAFDRFDGEIYQKSIMFDIWTRQRNFIGYYPRTLEWKIPTVSPHMNKDYANFFMSISKQHLDDRFAVELMFSNYYPKIAAIVSNSNGLKSINSIFENTMFFLSRVLKRFKINSFLPKKYANNAFEFDIPSVRYSKKDALYPLLASNIEVDSFINTLLSKKEVTLLYTRAYEGDIKSYGKLTALQSIALSLLKIEKYCDA